MAKRPEEKMEFFSKLIITAVVIDRPLERVTIVVDS